MRSPPTPYASTGWGSTPHARPTGTPSSTPSPGSPNAARSPSPTALPPPGPATLSAEALYDIDREILLAVHHPTRVLQHLSSVTALRLFRALGMSAGRAARRRDQARRARRLVLENPVAYYADADTELRGQLRAPALAEDLERLTGLMVERRAEGVALIDTSGRLSDIRFPAAVLSRKPRCCLPPGSVPPCSVPDGTPSNCCPRPPPPNASKPAPGVSTAPSRRAR
ncbi:DUF2398 family protein [Streptomyces mirabilis]|nr:DUF2398 family protein [Streptomyces mirabilis]